MNPGTDNDRRLARHINGRRAVGGHGNFPMEGRAAEAPFAGNRATHRRHGRFCKSEITDERGSKFDLFIAGLEWFDAGDVLEQPNGDGSSQIHVTLR